MVRPHVAGRSGSRAKNLHPTGRPLIDQVGAEDQLTPDVLDGPKHQSRGDVRQGAGHVKPEIEPPDPVSQSYDFQR